MANLLSTNAAPLVFVPLTTISLSLPNFVDEITRPSESMLYRIEPSANVSLTAVVFETVKVTSAHAPVTHMTSNVNKVNSFCFISFLSFSYSTAARNPDSSGVLVNYLSFHSIQRVILLPPLLLRSRNLLHQK